MGTELAAQVEELILRSGPPALIIRKMPESLGASANRQTAMFLPSGDHTGRTV